MKRFFVLIAATALAACSQPASNPTPHPDGGGGADGGSDAGSLMPLQPYLTNWQVGGQIEVSGVVVTGSNHAASTSTGYFYVQDPGAGGANTGVLVYRKKNTVADPLPNRGDVIHLVGTMDRYPSNGGQTEISGGTANNLAWQVLSSGATLPNATTHGSSDLTETTTAIDGELGTRVVLNDGPWVVTNDAPASQAIPIGDGGVFYGGFEVAPQSDNTKTVMVVTKFYKDLKSGGCEPNDAGAYAQNGTVFTTLGGVWDMTIQYVDGGTKQVPVRGANGIQPAGCDEFSHN